MTLKKANSILGTNYENWEEVSQHKYLSEDFIKECQDKVDWYNISHYQKLSESFIREFQDKVVWYYIFSNKNLSREVLVKFIEYVPEGFWFGKDIEFKKQKIIESGKYELEGDYIIAYKGVLKNGTSAYDSFYKYEVGGVCESNCDTDENDSNSFGLSAWTLEMAKGYFDERIFKVRIHLDDLGVMVRSFYKLRAFKLEILEEVKNEIQKQSR